MLARRMGSILWENHLKLNKNVILTSCPIFSSQLLKTCSSYLRPAEESATVASRHGSTATSIFLFVDEFRPKSREGRIT